MGRICAVETLADGSAGMDERELLIAVAGLFNQRGLQRVRDDAHRGGAGRALGVVLVRLAIDMLLQHHVCRLGQGRFGVFRPLSCRPGRRRS